MVNWARMPNRSPITGAVIGLLLTSTSSAVVSLRLAVASADATEDDSNASVTTKAVPLPSLDRPPPSRNPSRVPRARKPCREARR